MGTTSGYITRNQDLVINMDAANSRSYTSGSTTCECLVSTVEGVLENGTSFSPEYKGGWTFDGTNDYLNLGDRVNINPELDSFTCNVFFKIDPSSNDTNIIASKGNNSSGDIGWMIYYHSINEALTVRCNGNDAVSQRAGQHIPINKGQVYMVTLVINRTDNTIKGYLNGSNVGWIDGNYNGVFTSNSISGFGSITNSDDFLIGERPFLDLPMIGTIYLFQTYNFALSDAQVYRNFRFFGGRYDLSPPPPPPTFFNDYSFEFDGNNNCVAFQPVLNIDATNGLTLSFWVNLNVSAPWDYVISSGGSGVDSQLNLRWNANGGLTSWIVGSSQSTGISTGYGAWRHIVMTINYSNGDVKFYMDGVVSSTVLTFGSSYSNARLSTIGAVNSTGLSPTDGFIDEVSVFRSVFDQTAITNLYNNGKPTNLTSLSPHVWIRMGDNAVYKSPQWLLPSNENKDKFSNYSMSFDGTDDYMSTSVSSLNSTTAFTISFWGKKTSTTKTVGLNDKVTDTNKFLLYWWSNGTVYLGARNGASNSSATFALSYDSDWHHFMGVYVGGTSLRLYVDGILRDTITSSVPATLSSVMGNNITIGYVDNTSYTTGNIDEVAIWNSDQSANISTISSNPLNDLTSLSPIAYYKMGENATLKDPQWLLPNNENKDKISNYSMSFDGTDDWVNCGRDSSLDFNNAITISAWIKTDVTAGTTVMPILFKDGTGGTSRCYSLGFRPLSAGYDKAYIGIFHTNGNNTSVYTSTAGALSNGNWHHLMGTYDGTDNTDALKIYVDGVLDNTATPTPGDTGIHIKTNVDVAIGSLSHGTSWWWEGGVDEVAVWGTDQSSNISFIYSGGTGGTPPDLSSLNPISYWKMGEDATFSTNWTVPDQIGGNDGTSANMDINDRVGDAPSSSGNTVSFNMDINDRIGDAPSSENNALSYNMVLSGRTTDVPT